MDGTFILNQNFKEFIQLLNDNQVRYLVIGGYAVAFHGHPRYTRDIDIWLDRTPENAERVLKALKQFGFSSLGLQREDFLDPQQVIQLGYPPQRIDLLTSLEQMNFQECYESRIQVTLNEIPVNFIDLPHLRQSKQIAGRHQDLADLEHLQ